MGLPVLVSGALRACDLRRGRSAQIAVGVVIKAARPRGYALPVAIDVFDRGRPAAGTLEALLDWQPASLITRA